MTEPMPAPLRLESFKELAARRAALASHFEVMPSEEVVQTIEAMVIDAAERPQACKASTVALTSWLARQHEADALGALHASAVELELELTSLLLDAPADERALPKLGRLPEVPLGRYTAVQFPLPPRLVAMLKGSTDGWGGFEALHDLSRSEQHRHPYVVEHLCAHPDPVFIRRLLEAPWLRRKEVLLIATRRPTIAGIAYAVATNDRWLVDPQVREALAQNPFSPSRLLLSLLPSVGSGTLDLLSANGPVKDAARAVSARRHGERADGGLSA
jgi:hypothetical protein